jgi:K+-sensing histidine kinase KdpD
MDDDRDHRPDPDALLASLKAEESRAARARLKIFFGAAPGVGKTYAMLQEARRAHGDGEEVVIGVVETHGRPETEALVAGLPTLARRVSDHRGVQLTERGTDITRIVAGKPTHSRWRDLVRGSLLDALIRGSGSIEVHVIAPIDEGRPPPASAIPRERASGSAYAWAVLAIAVATAIGMVTYGYATLTDITMVYLIAITLASLAGRGPSLVAASLAVAGFDFCFVPPTFTFSVSEARYLMTFAVMFAAGLAISTLTTRLRRQERDALIRERHTAMLLAFIRDIAAAVEPADVAAVTVEHLEGRFRSRRRCSSPIPAIRARSLPWPV